MAAKLAADTGRVKYGEEAARRYQTRKTSKHAAEMTLLRRAVSRVPLGTMLDVPCGGGRVSVLMSQLGYRVTAADLSPAMVSIARETVRSAGVSVPVHERDLQQLDYDPQNFDSVVCFRLFHHFPSPEVRRQTVGEICRVARRHVLLSYFSPWSVTSVKRLLQERCFGRPRKKFHTPHSEIVEYFAAHHFVPVHDYAQFRFVHTLHVALFERKG